MTERLVAGRLAVAPRSARLSGPTRVLHAGAAAVATLSLLTLIVPRRARDPGRQPAAGCRGGRLDRGAGALAREASPAQRRVRRAILLALCAAGTGQLVWFLQPGGSTSVSLLADAIFIVGVAVGLGTLSWVLFGELDRAVLTGVVVDALILFVAGATLVLAAWRVASEAPFSSADLAGLLAAVALFASAGAWLMALTARRVRPTGAGPWAVLGGLLAVGIAWIVWLALSAQQAATTVAPSDFLFSAGILAFAYGGYTWDTATRGSWASLRLAAWLSESLPLGAVLACVVLLFVHGVGEAGGDVAALGAGAVMVLVTGRQALLLRRERSLEADRARLATAVAQSPESIVITDLAGAIEYVNPAFEQVTGFTRDEAIGANPRILKSGVQSDAFYRAMWASLTRGTPWVADLVNRRKDGSLYREEAVISPVRDEDGITTGYVAVKREVTRERAAEALATRLTRERALVAATIGQLRADVSPEATAGAICQEVVRLPGLHMAGLFAFMLDGRAAPLAVVTPTEQPAPLHWLPSGRSAYLRDRAEVGPWVETWTNRPGHPYNGVTLATGTGEVAYAPLRHGEALLGLLIASQPASAALALTEELPALVEFAGLAGVMLGPALAERTEIGRVRDQLSTTVAQRAFHPVFQPIVDVVRHRVVAYEALTRFADGSAPDVRFAEADRVGLGLVLEQATLEAALDAARQLPPRVWLHVNVSPALMLAGEPLRAIVAAARRRIVLEVTEHTVIDDYAAFRAALAALGPTVRLAVDDAGAGFASLRHILELQPALVKLDRSVIGGIDADPARQALVAGMVHFAQDTGCQLIAEGVETEAELRALQEHGIRLVQGYLLGLPAPLATKAEARS